MLNYSKHRQYHFDQDKYDRCVALDRDAISISIVDVHQDQHRDEEDYRLREKQDFSIDPQDHRKEIPNPTRTTKINHTSYKSNSITS